MKALPRPRFANSLALGVPAVLLAAACAPDPHPARFDYRDRSTGVLELHVLPATRMETTQFTVFGDGRVAGRTVTVGADPRVLEEWEDQVGEAQVLAWVELAVRSGLVDFDPDELMREIREAGGQVPYSVDGAAIFFEIRLDFLEGGPGGLQAPFSHSFVLSSSDAYLRTFTGTPEIQALSKIIEPLEETYWRARRR